MAAEGLPCAFFALVKQKGNPTVHAGCTPSGCLCLELARLRHAFGQNVTVRLPSSFSSILTQVASPGSSSSISSGHSMKHSAPL